jgi:hypothetical protein
MLYVLVLYIFTRISVNFCPNYLLDSIKKFGEDDKLHVSLCFKA